MSTPRNQYLFDLMQREHGLTLLESEMDDIERAVSEQLKRELADMTAERDALKAELQEYVDEGLIIKEDEEGL